MWLENTCKSLKNESNSVIKLIEEMKKISNCELPKKIKEKVKSSITYFENNKNRMNYSQAIKNSIPIGSGITESGCKIIVKERLGISGARWGNLGAKSMLHLKAINSTEGRWEQFWKTVTA